jgi:hypothetical protein
MKNIKFVMKCLAVVLMLFVSQISYADDGEISLKVKNDGVTVFSGVLSLPAEGVTSINDSSGSSYELDARSVLNIVNLADNSSSDFSISNLMYYSSFNAFYLKCITVGGDELCDGWQYKVNDTAPSLGMDQEILSGGESVILFFGNEGEEPEIVDIEVPTETAIEEEAPIEEKRHRSSTSRSTRIISPVEVLNSSPEDELVLKEIETLDKVATDVTINNPEVKIANPVIVNAPKIVTQKPASKPVSVANLAQESVATVLASSTPGEIDAVPVQKENWLRRIVRWIFGF